MWLTDELFLLYQRCHRRAFLEVYGDLSQREAPNDYVLKLRQDGIQQHQQVLTHHQPYTQPHYPNGNWRLGAEATLALMKQGVDRIYRGVLLHDDRNGLALVSRPDLLIKRSGSSLLGDWSYDVVDIKLGKRPKTDYQMIVAFHAHVLMNVQGTWPESASLLLRERGWYAVNLATILPQMQVLLEQCIQMLQFKIEPEVFIARSRCNLCQWFNHCYAIASQQVHLSLVPGVTPSRYTHLQELGLTTIASLAATNPEHLEFLPGFGPDVAHKLVQQAESVLQNQALLTRPLLKSASSLHSHPPSPLAALPTAKVELYFDIEAEPERNLAYLHGVLVVDYQAESEVFYPFLAETDAGESLIWQQFLELVWRYPDAPIFHFCPYEVQTVKRLGQLYNTSTAQLQPLLPRFIDLHAWITQTVTLPVESYALKPIARWLGFEWRNSTANGAQSIYWYSRWQDTGDRAFLEHILHYNEDDCRATYHVKRWLTGFLQNLSL